MSNYFSRLFKSDSPQPQSRFKNDKKLPPDFAEQILANDILLFLSGYSNKDSLNALVQLYMKGVEHYESLENKYNEYFEAKLQNLMNHPHILQQKQNSVKSFDTVQTPPQQPQHRNSIQKEITKEIIKPKPKPKIQQQEQPFIRQNKNYSDQLTQNLNNLRQLQTITSLNKEFEKCLPIITDNESCIDDGYLQQKEDDVIQTVKEQVFLQDEKRLTKQMMDQLEQEKIAMQTVSKSIYFFQPQHLQNEFDNQNQAITRRLNDRNSRRFSLSRANSQPILERLEFGLKQVNLSNLAHIQEESLHVSRKLSPVNKQ